VDRAALTALLNEGIAAVKAGDKARGRELLLRVVEADERVEPAWLWLSAVVDGPADQLVALENVLALNPRHPQALAGAERLRRQLGVKAEAAEATPTAPDGPEARETSSAPAEAPVPAATTQVVPTPAKATSSSPGHALATRGLDISAAEDDPDQCAYCGRPVDPEAERCPYCRRGLLTSGLWQPGLYQYLLLILVGLQLQFSMLQGLAAFLKANYPETLSFLPMGELLAPAGNPLGPATVRVVAWAVLLMMLLNDSGRAYGAAAGLAALDLAWAGGGLALGMLAKELAAVIAALASGIALTGVSATISQAQARRRLRVVPDRGLNSAMLFHRRAGQYARRGLWALAALHWQRAIVHNPREPMYYKALGRAQARLGRYASAVRSFRSGAELAPEDREFARLIEAVRALTRSS
jgi:tetratricopeptide (TPR) repeat protein